MANITLMKSDGMHLNVPAASIRAVISLALTTPQAGRENARSLLVTDFRGFSLYFMADAARDIVAQIDKAQGGRGALRLKKPKGWAAFQVGEDQTYFEEGMVCASEGVSYPLRDGEPKVDRLRLHWKRPDGEWGTDDVDLTEDNLKAAGAVVAEEGN